VPWYLYFSRYCHRQIEHGSQLLWCLSYSSCTRRTSVNIFALRESFCVFSCSPRSTLRSCGGDSLNSRAMSRDLLGGFRSTAAIMEQGDSKRWTQRACTSCRRYGLNSKRRLNTCHTVGFGIPSSLLALRVGLRGLRSTDSLCAQIGDSNDKYSFTLEVECWNEDETHAAQQSPTSF